MAVKGNTLDTHKARMTGPVNQTSDVSVKPGMGILFIAPYPFDQAPSQRFRFEQYFPYLQKEGITWHLAPFWSNKAWEILYSKGNRLRKSGQLLLGYIRRLRLLFTLHKYEHILIHREAAPLGPPVFEWILSRILRRRFCYDFDDAIWMPNTSKENSLAARLKYHGKVASICAWAHCVTCGNPWLASYARQYNNKVEVIPTTIDTDYHVPGPPRRKKKLTIGWTGTHSTAPYLERIRNALRKVAAEVPLEFLVISNHPPADPDAFWRYEKWERNAEIQQLRHMDIGVMPLEDREWEKGKCGFKALQYMAIGIPVVASPVGVNTEIIENGHSGYLCTHEEEWYEHLMKLANDPKLRQTMGARGRETVEHSYSCRAYKDRFLHLLVSA